MMACYANGRTLLYGGVGDTRLLRICIDDSRAVRNPTGQWLCLGRVVESQKLRFPNLLRLAC